MHNIHEKLQLTRGEGAYAFPRNISIMPPQLKMLEPNLTAWRRGQLNKFAIVIQSQLSVRIIVLSKISLILMPGRWELNTQMPRHIGIAVTSACICTETQGFYMVPVSEAASWRVMGRRRDGWWGGVVTGDGAASWRHKQGSSFPQLQAHF